MVEIHVQVEIYRVVSTLFGKGRAGSHVVEIHVQVEIYRVASTLFGKGRAGPHVVEIHKNINDCLFVR